MVSSTNTSEEYRADQLAGVSVEIALLSEQQSNITETDTISGLTEPGSAEYARQSTTLSVSKVGGDYRLTNADKLTFDVSNSTITVRSYAILVNFTSDEKGGASGWHILSLGSFTDQSDLSAGIDIIEIASGSIGFDVS